MTRENAGLIKRLRKLEELFQYSESRISKKTQIRLANPSRPIEKMGSKELHDLYNRYKHVITKFIVGKSYVSWYIIIFHIKSDGLHVFYGKPKKQRSRRISNRHAHYIVNLETYEILYRPINAPHVPDSFIYKKASSN